MVSRVEAASSLVFLAQNGGTDRSLILKWRLTGLMHNFPFAMDECGLAQYRQGLYSFLAFCCLWNEV